MSTSYPRGSLLRPKSKINLVHQKIHVSAYSDGHETNVLVLYILQRGQQQQLHSEANLEIFRAPPPKLSVYP